MKIRKLFTNVDVFAITKELDQLLSNSTISNIYEIEDLLLLKINTSEGKKILIIKSDARLNITNFNYPIPKYPSQYIISIRKFLKNRRILSVSQHNFDRIVIIELYNPNSEPWKLIIELFNKGNYILVDENSIIKVAKKYKTFRDRVVLAGREYEFPKSRGLDFLKINKNEFIDLIKSSDTEIVRNLARNINIAGLYSEEVCYRARIDKTLVGKDLDEEQLNELFNSFKDLRNELLFGDIDASIIIDRTGAEVSVVPFEIKMFHEYETRNFKLFNNAVDEFFSKIDEEKIMQPTNEAIIAKISQQEKILKNQIEYLEDLKSKKKKYYEYGDFIYTHFRQLEKLIYIINTAKSKGYSWEDINEKMQNAKLQNLNGSEFFKMVVPSTKQLVIKINEDDLYLDLKKTIGDNATNVYNKGKKAEKKIKGTIPAIEKTKTNIANLKLEKDSKEAEINFLIKKQKKHWYEKFRWFYSSDQFLVIGGRDSSSNETLYKKYLDLNDLVFHTDFPGSPLALIKNPEKKEIPERTINEAADFVASYSRAWKEGWGIADVFYVLPTQISKSPPSKEFLTKGSFIISGKKSFVKNAKTELAISLDFDEIETDPNKGTKVFYPKLITGPLRALKERFENIVIIKPSKSGLKKGKLAKELKNHFLKNSDKKMKKWINLLSIDEITLYLPNGLSIIKKSN